MTSTQSYNNLHLPQEILDLIIDEVARLKPVLDSQAALRTCTLVSRAFCRRSRKHLWADFVFYMDRSSRKRATDLIHMLRRRDNRSLVAHVRSMQLVFNTPVEDEQHRLVRAKNTLSKAIKRPFQKYFKPQYTVLDVLQHIQNCDFEHFSVNSLEQTRPIHWTKDEFSKVIKPTLLEVLSSNTRIKSFSLCNIGSISKQMVAAAFFSPEMEDLTMRNLQFGEDELVTFTVERDCVLADLRKLEMINVPMLPLLSLIHLLVPHSWPSGSLSSSDFTSSDLEPQPLFPRLQTLVVSVPYPEDMNPLWKLILGGASCLENLEMEYHYRRYGIPELGQLSLRRLTALRNFRFRTVSPDDIVWVEASQRVLLNIFTFPCFTEKLRSFELQYLFSAAWDTSDHTNGKPLERLRNAAHWEVIDDWLVSDHFRSFETLQLSVKVVHSMGGSDAVYYIPADEMLAAALLMFPKMTAKAHIEVIMEGQIFFRLNPTM
ncbi:hypothetical protein JR316_0005192 [Psilocybe cubensis]|uniref:Uncharacterized protein n=2 Tax=Psilocybe cubensis TaxID=181762 RepID=A0A8H7Y1T4_PSICU|nr:hypothetical protein JR316_0005192 [Psilocybe cubensis]KAH9483092.1 hypothetical protein JR316_0005192 [Psilocybe cubensis]